MACSTGVCACRHCLSFCTNSAGQEANHLNKRLFLSCRELKLEPSIWRRGEFVHGKCSRMQLSLIILPLRRSPPGLGPAFDCDASAAFPSPQTAGALCELSIPHFTSKTIFAVTKGAAPQVFHQDLKVGGGCIRLSAIVGGVCGRGLHGLVRGAVIPTASSSTSADQSCLIWSMFNFQAQYGH